MLHCCLSVQGVYQKWLPNLPPNARKVNPHLMTTVWCFLWSTRFSIIYEAHGTELLIWLAIITFSHAKLITANILAGLEFFMSSVLLPIFITRCWQRSIIRLSLLHFSKTAHDLDCICACLRIWYGWGTNKVTWGENSLIPIPWKRAGTRICWSVDLLKCGFTEVQIYWSADLLKCRFAKTQLRKACAIPQFCLSATWKWHILTWPLSPTDPW